MGGGGENGGWEICSSYYMVVSLGLCTGGGFFVFLLFFFGSGVDICSCYFENSAPLLIWESLGRIFPQYFFSSSFPFSPPFWPPFSPPLSPSPSFVTVMGEPTLKGENKFQCVLWESLA